MCSSFDSLDCLAGNPTACAKRFMQRHMIANSPVIRTANPIVSIAPYMNTDFISAALQYERFLHELAETSCKPLGSRHFDNTIRV